MKPLAAVVIGDNEPRHVVTCGRYVKSLSVAEEALMRSRVTSRSRSRIVLPVLYVNRHVTTTIVRKNVMKPEKGNRVG